jgi:aminoglycoside 2''-phosphotransferase
MELEKKYIDLVMKKFPGISFTDTTLITKGWDNDVLLLDNAYVFRFPKRKNSKDRFSAEVKLLEHLQSDSPLPIPKYEHLSVEPPFGGYKIIKGQEMLPELFAELNENAQDAIAKQLSDFLSFLHSTSIEVAEEVGFQEEPGGYWWSKERTAERYEALKELVFPNLTQEEASWARHQFETYLEFDFNFKLTVTHSDMKMDHIFFDSNRDKITGIIDFAEVEIGDPALDFTGLWDYGEDFVTKVLKQYRGIYNDDFLKRSKFPRLVRNLGNMLKISEGRTLPVSYDDCYKRQRNIIALGMNL